MNNNISHGKAALTLSYLCVHSSRSTAQMNDKISRE